MSHAGFSARLPKVDSNRLHAALVHDLQKIDEASSDVWPKIKPRTLMEIEGYVDIPSIGRAIASGDQLANIMEMMRLFAPEQGHGRVRACAGGNPVRRPDDGWVRDRDG